MDECGALLWHGNGHQSKTKCQLKGKHSTHFAVYGGDEQEAYWKSNEASTGFFNEPPEGGDSERDNGASER
jgi:hypothetical protein